MKRTSITALIAATALAGTLSARAQTGVTVAASAASVVNAELTVTARNGEKQTREVELVNRQGPKLAYRDKDGPKEASLNINVSEITSLDFNLPIESEPFTRALANRDWTVVATTLWPVITPLMPYIDLPDNNAAGFAYIMGSAMIKVADGHRKTNATDKASRLYQEAHKVLAVLARTEWFEQAQAAQIKGVLCLIALTNIPLAEAQLKALQAPEIGDATWGIYWYAQALLKAARGDPRGAMNAVTRSLTFENKDIDIFPDALMLSAKLYEDLLEPYQARDVYYEVAKVFPNTEWSTAAREHLKFIMDKGLTKGKEKTQVEMVFFGLKDDVNALATALLKGKDQPPAAEELDTNIEIDEADMQSGKKGAPPPDADASAPPADPGAKPDPAPVDALNAAKQAGKASAGAKAAKTEALK
jgi:tetratricopeptide (TPR) repeat protein